jgi:hypothetical protein
MRFEKVALKKTWTAPSLHTLSPDDPLVRRAIAEDADFAEQVRRRKVARD